MFQPSVFFTPKSFFATAQERDQYTELKYLAKIVGTTYFRHNDEVNVPGEVRLLDGQNKLIGIYNVIEARKKCKELNTDLVLINPNSKPMTCKAMNYKEDLYKKFMKDVFEKDLPKIAKEIQRRGETSKSIKLGSKMTIADLRNKASAAQGIAKQVKNVRIYMIVTDETEENGRNVMFTFRDLTKDFLVPKRDIEEVELDEEEEDGKIFKKDVEKEDRKVLAQEFQSFIFSDQRIELAQKTVKDYTEEEVKQIINTYIIREMKKSKIDEGLEMLKAQGDEDLQAVLDETKGGDESYTDSEDLVLGDEEGEFDLNRARDFEGKVYGDLDEYRERYGKNDFERFFNRYQENMSTKQNLIRKLETIKRNVENQNRKFRK